MREILFRAKRRDSGEWIYGYYQPPIPAREDIGTTLAVFTDDGFLEDIRVDPETVGQYIGLIDADGKKIFEGDILESPVIHYSRKLTRRIIVTDIRECKFMSLYVNEYRVAGNVHDNPEMLEVEYE